MNEVKVERYSCLEQDAKKIAEWIQTRGGIMIWKSINLGNPGASWTSPATHADGTPGTKPNWQSANEPERHITKIEDVDVIREKEYKRFHVAVRMGSGGMSLKVSDGGTRRIRQEVAKAEEKTGKAAWHCFDYGAEKNAAIMVEDEKISMVEFLTESS